MWQCNLRRNPFSLAVNVRMKCLRCCKATQCVTQSLFFLSSRRVTVILMTNKNKTRCSSEQKFSHTLYSLWVARSPHIQRLTAVFAIIYGLLSGTGRLFRATPRKHAVASESGRHWRGGVHLFYRGKDKYSKHGACANDACPRGVLRLSRTISENRD